MIDDIGSLQEASRALSIARRETEMISSNVASHLRPQSSPTPRWNEAGVIHGRAIEQDPASAQEIIKGYSSQVGWANDLLSSQIEALTGQEDSNARGLDIADTGGAVGSIGAGLPAQPSNQSVPLTFVPPVVFPGASLLQLANNFNATKFGELAQAAVDWNTMASNIRQVVDQLNNAASTIDGQNDSEFTRSAANKI